MKFHIELRLEAGRHDQAIVGRRWNGRRANRRDRIRPRRRPRLSARGNRVGARRLNWLPRNFASSGERQPARIVIAMTTAPLAPGDESPTAEQRDQRGDPRPGPAIVRIRGCGAQTRVAFTNRLRGGIGGDFERQRRRYRSTARGYSGRDLGSRLLLVARGLRRCQGCVAHRGSCGFGRHRLAGPRRCCRRGRGLRRGCPGIIRRSRDRPLQVEIPKLRGTDGFRGRRRRGGNVDRRVAVLRKGRGTKAERYHGGKSAQRPDFNAAQCRHFPPPCCAGWRAVACPKATAPFHSLLPMKSRQDKHFDS